MDSVRQWATAICFTAMAGGLCLLLVPNNNMGKMLRMTVSVFFLCSLMLPFTGTNFTIDMSEFAAQQEKADEIAKEITMKSQEEAYKAAELNINELVNKILADEGIKPTHIAINISKDQQDILIVSAKIQLEEDYQILEKKIKSLLEAAGVRAELQFNQSTQN